MQTRHFVRDSVGNPFEMCEQLGVDQASIQLPTGEKEAILSRLKELRDMREKSAYAEKGKVSAYTVDQVSEAIWIQEVLGEDVEIISNETKRLENMNTEEYVQAVAATRGYRKPTHLDMAMEAIDRRIDQLAEKPNVEDTG